MFPFPFLSFHYPFPDSLCSHSIPCFHFSLSTPWFPCHLPCFPFLCPVSCFPSVLPCFLSLGFLTSPAFLYLYPFPSFPFPAFPGFAYPISSHYPVISHFLFPFCSLVFISRLSIHSITLTLSVFPFFLLFDSYLPFFLPFWFQPFLSFRSSLFCRLFRHASPLRPPVFRHGARAARPVGFQNVYSISWCAILPPFQCVVSHHHLSP